MMPGGLLVSAEVEDGRVGRLEISNTAAVDTAICLDVNPRYAFTGNVDTIEIAGNGTLSIK